MAAGVRELIGELAVNHRLREDEYQKILDEAGPEDRAMLAREADRQRRAVYGDAVYIRGLIEISSFCRNDCLYCGLRRSNASAQRYRLAPEAILECARRGYALGFRTFVLQGGEDGYYTDEVLTGLIGTLRREFPDSAVTLSLGERSRESYRRLFEAGAERYLLRHETADPVHYRQLHPPQMSYENRMRCLADLRKIGYQVGCGFMVGSPGQTHGMIARDLAFIESFRPQMCGIGPFIPHRETPFRNHPGGGLALTLLLLSMIRLIHPGVLLPATTALATIHPMGREMGLRAGANVVMPNLSPADVRGKYDLYDGKLSGGAEAAERLESLRLRVREAGYRVETCRGDAVGFAVPGRDK